MKVSVDADACICSAYCVEDAPTVFRIEGFTVEVLQPEPGEELAEAVEAASAHCPARAITVTR